MDQLVMPQNHSSGQVDPIAAHFSVMGEDGLMDSAQHAMDTSPQSLDWSLSVASATCSLVQAYRALEIIDRSMIPRSGELTFERLCQSLCSALVFIDELGSAELLSDVAWNPRTLRSSGNLYAGTHEQK